MPNSFTARLALAANCVATSVAHFISLEVGNFVKAPSRLGLLATGWHWAMVAVIRMEAVIDVAVEIGRAMKPWASTNEDAA